MLVPLPYIVDTTLRDGEQSPGVVFSPFEKYQIAELLQELGVDEVEAGTPAIGLKEQKAIKDIAKAGFSFKTSCWCRARKEEIIEASKLGTQSVNISLPVSNIQIQTLGKTRKWVLEEATRVISFAKQHFEYVTIGAQDATRAENNFLKEFIFYTQEAEADRIRISDTVGIYDPIETFKLIEDLKSTFRKVKYEFHAHNDFGMATANTIAAIKSGVHGISATVNGLGERAGNAALEEVIAYLSFKGISTRFNTKVIKRLSNCISLISDTELSKQKAITGKNAFKHESGIHTSAILKNIKSYQILKPKDYGANQSPITFGKHSGTASIISFFKNIELEIDRNTAESILIVLKQLVYLKKQNISEDELISIYNDFKRKRDSIKISNNQ